MCNLYSMTKGQQAIRDFGRASRDSAGNLPPLPGIFPDMLAPVVRTAPDGERELLRMRWGHALPASIRDAVGDQHSQHGQPALAPVAGAGEPGDRGRRLCHRWAGEMREPHISAKTLFTARRAHGTRRRDLTRRHAING